MTPSCRSCASPLEPELAGERPARRVWWCPRCRLIDFDPTATRSTSDYPRSSSDRQERTHAA